VLRILINTTVYAVYGSTCQQGFTCSIHFQKNVYMYHIDYSAITIYIVQVSLLSEYQRFGLSKVANQLPVQYKKYAVRKICI
jgi:hypothetical protein